VQVPRWLSAACSFRLWTVDSRNDIIAVSMAALDLPSLGELSPCARFFFSLPSFFFLSFSSDRRLFLFAQTPRRVWAGPLLVTDSLLFLPASRPWRCTDWDGNPEQITQATLFFPSFRSSANRLPRSRCLNHHFFLRRRGF